jgi:hypothetical protein
MEINNIPAHDNNEKEEGKEKEQYNCVLTDYSWGPKCNCGANKTYSREPNLEYLHAPYCDLYLSPNWIDNLNAKLLK